MKIKLKKQDQGLQTDNPLALYMKELRRGKLLTADEEKELGRRIQEGDNAALNKLVESNLRFVIRVAKKYRGFGVPFQDLINEGNVGLIEAAKRFDPSRNIRFISYAVWWIRQSILLAIANMGHTFRLPPKVNTELYKALRIKKQVSPESEVKERKPDETPEIIQKLIHTGTAVSIDEAVHPNSEQDLKETLVQQNEESVEQKMIKQRAHLALHSALGSLSEREADVLRMRFGLEDDQPRSLKEIGESMGLSRERIRQIQVQAIERLRMTDLVNCYN